MPTTLSINVDWEALQSDSPEEQACFGAIGITAQNTSLTEGWDELAKRLRKAPFLSAYHLGEWIAWNWWRLRWEPRTTDPNWAFSHHLSTIGGGYIWPNITVFSDGERIALVARPTDERPTTPFRYIADYAAIIQASEFEASVDTFIEQVLQRLDDQNVKGSNLSEIWKGIMDERRTPGLAASKKLEALLGNEPDETDPKVLSRLLEDAAQLSMGAIEEIAADRVPGGHVPTAEELQSIARSKGFDLSPRDAARLAPRSGLPRTGAVAAWYLGARAAKALREQEKLGSGKIGDKLLAALAGTSASIVTDHKSGSTISFALDESHQHGRVVLRSKWETGRRFELARLIGDRVVAPTAGRLLPATRTYTYRQKVQRSFAAEFLSPFEAVDEMLGGDYSAESQADVADHFGVSELTIGTLLMNHRRIPRDDFDAEIEAPVPSAM